MPRKSPSVDTTEGRQKIVDWMRWGVDHINGGSCTGWGLSIYLIHQPINTLVVLLSGTQQIECGGWPDDDVALQEWWNTEGKDMYRETPQAPKYGTRRAIPYPSHLPDTPPTYSFQKCVDDGLELTREQRIARFLT